MIRISLLTVLAAGWWTLPVFGCVKPPTHVHDIIKSDIRDSIKKVLKKMSSKRSDGVMRSYEGRWSDSRGERGTFVSVLHLSREGWSGGCLGYYDKESYRYTLLLNDGRQLEFSWVISGRDFQTIKNTDGSEFVLLGDDGISMSISYVEGERIRKGNMYYRKSSTTTTIRTGDYELSLRSYMKKHLLVNFLHRLPAVEAEGKARITEGK